ncbi:unnamed protein product [Schistosoma mattheei]|uniref:Uncharacterized protein n=1 Tax=Schistosoma mattheei TaxID=31246 RepID=A0A3P8AVW2_9TREM|nr:unnamed protein product [Schistosoma mattheei]
MFRPIWDSSAGCTCTSELMFTVGLEHNTICFKRYHIFHLSTSPE